MNGSIALRMLLSALIALVLIAVLSSVFGNGGQNAGSVRPEVAQSLFGGIAFDAVRRVDVDGPDTELRLEVRTKGEEIGLVRGSGRRVLPARNERVRALVEALFDVEGVRVVSENASRHEELRVEGGIPAEERGFGSYEVTILSGDRMQTLFVAVSESVNAVYLRAAEEATVYAVPDELSFYLSRPIDFYGEFRLLLGRIERSDIRRIEFSGLYEAEIVRTERGFVTADRSDGVNVTAATAIVSRLLSLEGDAYVPDRVTPESVLVEATVETTGGGRIVVEALDFVEGVGLPVRVSVAEGTAVDAQLSGRSIVVRFQLAEEFAQFLDVLE